VAEDTDPDTEAPFTDAELTALALAADPDEPLDPAAQPIELGTAVFAGGLPDCYMPPANARSIRGWRRSVAIGTIASFLVIDACGLCITYGHLVIA
jgi:hypothetical protein